MSLAVASRYANALVDAVLGSKGAVQPDAVVQNLRELETALEQSPDFYSALLSPAIPLAKKNAIMGRICDHMGAHRLVRNFILIVVRNRRGNLFPQIRSAFERVLDERTGLQRAEVESAFELNPAAQAGLETQLSRLTGKRIRCHYKVDQALIGGVIARIGSTVYDGSVRGQLETLRRKLSAGA